MLAGNQSQANTSPFLVRAQTCSATLEIIMVVSPKKKKKKKKKEGLNLPQTPVTLFWTYTQSMLLPTTRTVTQLFSQQVF
jgi:hypothetical protein